MTEYTRPALWEDVRRLVELLDKHGVRYVLVGGYALAAHRYLRPTHDVDVAVDPSPENAKRWIAALSELPERAAEELLGEDDPFQGDYLHAIRINDEISIDVMPSVSGIPFEEVERDAVRLSRDGQEVSVISLEALLRIKERSQRDKDKADAAMIRAALRLKER